VNKRCHEKKYLALCFLKISTKPILKEEAYKVVQNSKSKIFKRIYVFQLLLNDYL
jgi:hypothetical protein